MNILILLLAGSSSRLNSETKKQFHLIQEKPIFIHTYETFKDTNKFDKFLFVISKDDEQIVNAFLEKFNLKDKISLVYGGTSRQESVYNALKSLENKIPGNSKILIHDAARVLVRRYLILDILSNLENYSCVCPAIKVFDSMVKFQEDEIVKYENRDNFKLIQTPQGFIYDNILKAHEAYKNINFTDDCSMIMKLKQPVKLIEGDFINFKVTTKQDLELAQILLEARK